MGKWTQGPWRAEASDYEGCLQIISADRKRPITELWARWNDMTEAELAFAIQATTAALAKAGVR